MKNEIDECKKELVQKTKKLYIQAIKEHDTETIDKICNDTFFYYKYKDKYETHLLCCEYDLIKEAIKHEWFMEDYYHHYSIYYLIDTNKRKELFLLINEFTIYMSDYILDNKYKHLYDLLFLNKETLNHLLDRNDNNNYTDDIVSIMKQYIKK